MLRYLLLLLLPIAPAVELAHVSVTAIPPADPYYSRASLLVRLDKPVSGAAWLVVGYLDRGYGVISIASHRVSDRDQRGIARLNTGKLLSLIHI